MMFISIVSHGHADLIIELNVISELSKKNTVILTDNIGEQVLEKYCLKHDITYILNYKRKGFGENNNQNFKKAKELGMRLNDYFLVLNPDVVINPTELDKLKSRMSLTNSMAGTINLLKTDQNYDNNIRYFPALYDFVGSYLFGNTNTIIDKGKISINQEVDWASGAFIAVSSWLYEKVGGFDERYFMYCEDLDLCKRIKKETGKGIIYYPDIYALHKAAHQNRKIISKHFYWHLKSIFRYSFLSKY
ncbi:glycosyltransferase family 2 protein [Escherichia coli]|nr:glycosyltransferase family 2 protein [Escherichia coli]RZX12399.1 glycosyltransferase family 2 protein [Escherichia coli]